MLQFKPLTRNSNLLAIKRGEEWGVALFSFTQLTGFCFSPEKKIFVLEKMSFRTSAAHLRSWMDAVKAGGAVLGIEGFETIKVPSERLEEIFDVFTRLP